MVSLPFRRVLAALAFAFLVMAFAPTSAEARAPRRAASGREAGSPASLVTTLLRGLLVFVTGAEGIDIDPNGVTNSGEEGPDLDPDSVTSSGDEGLDIDPDGQR